MPLLLLLSSFSCVRLYATPETAAHQAPPSLGFSRQEHWSGLPFPSPMHESENWKWSRSVVSDPQQPHGLQPSRILHPWDFPGRNTGVGCHCTSTLCGSNWVITNNSTLLITGGGIWPYIHRVCYDNNDYLSNVQAIPTELVIMLKLDRQLALPLSFVL